MGEVWEGKGQGIEREKPESEGSRSCGSKLRP